MKVLVRYIVTGCIFLCAERFVTGSGFEPPAAPPTHLRGECPARGGGGGGGGGYSMPQSHLYVKLSRKIKRHVLRFS